MLRGMQQGIDPRIAGGLVRFESSLTSSAIVAGGGGTNALTATIEGSDSVSSRPDRRLARGR